MPAIPLRNGVSRVFERVCNAVVTAVYPPGAPDRHGDVTQSSTAVWEGSQRGYIRTVEETRSETDTVGVIETDEIFLPAAPAALVAVLTQLGAPPAAGSVEITDHRSGASSRWRLVGCAWKSVGLPVDSVRVALSSEMVNDA